MSDDPQRGAGSLRRRVERALELAEHQRAEDGTPLVDKAPLDRKKDLELSFEGGACATIRLLPGRGGPRGLSEGLLMQVALPASDDGRTSVVYNVRARNRPYTERHLILSNPEPQELCPGHLRAGFQLLWDLGPGYSGYFNGTAPTHPRFHLQFHGDRLPLWESISRNTARIEDRHPVGSNGIEGGTLAGWPFTADVLESQDPEALAEATWEIVEAWQSAGCDKSDFALPSRNRTDLLFTCDEESVLKVVLVKRYKGETKPNPGIFYPDPDAYGDFGGLELSGMVVSVRDRGAFNWFEANPEEAPRRLQAAMREVVADS